MNRFFDREEWRRGFPQRAYARLDDVEPIAAGPNDDLTFVFDAVDADWPGFARGGIADLEQPGLLDSIASYWRNGLGGKGAGRDGPDPYGECPIYRIEITPARVSRLFGALPHDEEPWISIVLSEEPFGTPAQVYGGLFGEPTTAYVNHLPGSAPSAQLSAMFDMVTWPDANPQDLLSALGQPCILEALVCFDIGQGLAAALVCACGMPIYYFDTGCGSGRNTRTAPTSLDFCTCSQPTVILSHWDTDHWAAASGHSRLQQLTWIVPRQTISVTHTAFANSILNAGGKILVVGNGPPALQWRNAQQDFDLRRGTGSGRNGTGLVLIVTDQPSGRSWVLTGDTGYDDIPHPVPRDVAAMLVPHHGANMGPNSIPLARPAGAYARLLYSFGPDNAHGAGSPPVRHPVSQAVAAHSGSGWAHGAWSVATPAHALAGSDVLATATHLSTHLGGAAAGWNGPPTIVHLGSCPDAMAVPQT